MREELLKLLTHDDCPIFMVFGDNMEGLADFLIAHGVTIPTRCFECQKEGTEECKMVHRDKLTGCLFAETKGTDFCSYGERRNDNAAD